jgi:hypothetical protein
LGVAWRWLLCSWLTDTWRWVWRWGVVLGYAACVLENLTTVPPCQKAKAAIEKWVSWDIDSIKVE